MEKLWRIMDKLGCCRNDNLYMLFNNDCYANPTGAACLNQDGVLFAICLYCGSMRGCTQTHESADTRPFMLPS